MTIDERLELFKYTWGIDAIHTKTSQFYIVNLYEKKRKGSKKMDTELIVIITNFVTALASYILGRITKKDKDNY